MEKLTLKEIAGYLPYQLKGEFKLSQVAGVDLEKDEIRKKLLTADSCQFFLNYCKPHLFPLEMLTKKIVHNGVEIIPIVELAKISIGLKNIQNIKIDSKFLKVNFETHREDYSLLINKGIDFYLTNISLGGSINTRICGQKEFFEKLYEWHFDIHGLIPRGLAVSKEIDKSTLNSK